MTLGVIISKLLGLDNYASSAILVVLCIKHTKVHSLQAIISRLVSCFLVLFLGSAIFSLLGQSPIVLRYYRIVIYTINCRIKRYKKVSLRVALYYFMF